MNIDGITYNLISSKIIGQNVEHKLQRPNGRRFYFVVVYPNGALSSVV
jgi:hypothetical protein